MNKKQYTQWLKNVTDIPDATMSVENEIEKYPYCMLFHLIQSMKTDSMESRSILAVLHPCRKKLSALLLKGTENVRFDIEYDTKEKKLKKEKEKKETIVKETSPEFRNKEDLLDILQKRLAELKEHDATEKKEQKEEPLYEPQSTTSLDELVEKFNKFPPKISFNPEDSNDETNCKDLGKSSITDEYTIVSETLAELYYSQGIYDKALKIYEVLMLKYPEKSDTFAKIIENINSKKNNTN
ncbi:MAG: hypothetical protein LBL13_02180 [Bacteroidales bacterium]|jgi:hypothetical protein|nr:hypothetical protein [Bacteroidales bacterium]